MYRVRSRARYWFSKVFLIGDPFELNHLGLIRSNLALTAQDEYNNCFTRAYAVVGALKLCNSVTFGFWCGLCTPDVSVGTMMSCCYVPPPRSHQKLFSNLLNSGRFVTIQGAGIKLQPFCLSHNSIDYNRIKLSRQNRARYTVMRHEKCGHEILVPTLSQVLDIRAWWSYSYIYYFMTIVTMRGILTNQNRRFRPTTR